MQSSVAILLLAALAGVALASGGDGGLKPHYDGAGGKLEGGKAARDAFNAGKSAKQIAKEAKDDSLDVFARKLDKKIDNEEFEFESGQHKGSSNKLVFKLKQDDGVSLRLHVSVVNATDATAQHIEEEMGIRFLKVFKYTPETAGDVWTNGTARTVLVDLKNTAFDDLSCEDVLIGDATSNATVTTCKLATSDGKFTLITELGDGIFFKSFGSNYMKVAPTSLKITLNVSVAVGAGEQVAIETVSEAERDSNEHDGENTDGVVANVLSFGTVSLFTWETTALNAAGSTIDVKSATGPQGHDGDVHDRSVVFCFPAGEGSFSWDPSLDAGQSFTGLAASSAATLVASFSALLALLALALFA